MRALAVTVAMAILWVTEALPIPVTSLLPVLAFPLMGVLSSAEVTAKYANDLIYLFFGGFFLALTLERWNVHRRIALLVVSAFGSKPRAVILGIMVAVAGLSMWISNTATALMMLPICLALADQLKDCGASKEDVDRFATALLLGTAYAANIGGMGTPIGTGPNGIFMAFFESAAQPSFAQWMMFAIPLVVVFVAAAWFLLTGVLFKFAPEVGFGERDYVRAKLRDMGRLSPQERATLAVFCLTVLLWVTRRDLDLGGFRIPGWLSGLDALGMTWTKMLRERFIGDSAVSILAVILLCVIRVGPKRQPLADWSIGARVPWGMLLLLGGGFAIAGSFGVGGEEGLSLSAYCGAKLGALGEANPLFVLPSIALSVSVLTEFTSNTATTSVMIPLLAEVGSAETSRLLCLTATLSASCAFMFPVATPPNAIVFASGRLRIKTMMKAGIGLNLVGAILIPICVWFLARLFLPPLN